MNETEFNPRVVSGMFYAYFQSPYERSALPTATLEASTRNPHLHERANASKGCSNHRVKSLSLNALVFPQR